MHIPDSKPDFPVACFSGTFAHKPDGIRVAIGCKIEMNVRSITIVVAVLVMSTLAGAAQDWAKGSQGSTVWTIPNSQPRTQNPEVATSGSHFFLTRNLYAQLGAGYLYQPDTTFEIFSSNGSSTTSSSGNLAFNPGVRADVNAGYNINRRWSVEFDTGLIWSSADNPTLNLNLNTYTVPMLLNVIYNVPLKGPWSSYMGIGAGGAASILSYRYSPTSYYARDNDFVFAYQAKAGLRYSLSKSAAFDISYEFLGTTDPSWNATQSFSGGIPPTTYYQLKEQGFYTHSLVISFTWTF